MNEERVRLVAMSEEQRSLMGQWAERIIASREQLPRDAEARRAQYAHEANLAAALAASYAEGISEEEADGLIACVGSADQGGMASCADWTAVEKLRTAFQPEEIGSPSVAEGGR